MGTACGLLLMGSIYFKDVASGLGDANFLEFWPKSWKDFFPALLQALVDQQPEILGGGHNLAKLFDLFIQILMIKRRQHALSYKPVQFSRIDSAPGAAVHRPADADVDDVIVAVSERVIAFAVEALILCFGQGFGVQPMRGRKSVSPGYADHGVSPK